MNHLSVKKVFVTLNDIQDMPSTNRSKRTFKVAVPLNQVQQALANWPLGIEARRWATPQLHYLPIARNFARATQTTQGEILETTAIKTGHNGQKLGKPDTIITAAGPSSSPASNLMFPTRYPDDTTNPHITATDIKRNLLPLFLLANIQSFGYSVDTDKTSELQSTLINNRIDIACITKTWLSENIMDYIFFQGYTSFHSVRNGV